MNMVFVNFPVSDLARSIAFYEKLGFKQNAQYTDDNASAMVWDEHFVIMLLKYDFYRRFIGDKKIADTKTASAALIAFTMPNADAVKEFGRIARENGGGCYRVDMGVPEDQMYGLEVQDPDGNMLEPTWMPSPS